MSDPGKRVRIGWMLVFEFRCAPSCLAFEDSLGCDNADDGSGRNQKDNVSNFHPSKDLKTQRQADEVGMTDI
jgi:hypothetical protein